MNNHINRRGILIQLNILCYRSITIEEYSLISDLVLLLSEYISNKGINCFCIHDVNIYNKKDINWRHKYINDNVVILNRISQLINLVGEDSRCKILLCHAYQNFIVDEIIKKYIHDFKCIIYLNYDNNNDFTDSRTAFGLMNYISEFGFLNKTITIGDADGIEQYLSTYRIMLGSARYTSYQITPLIDQERINTINYKSTVSDIKDKIHLIFNNEI